MGIPCETAVREVRQTQSTFSNHTQTGSSQAKCLHHRWLQQVKFQQQIKTPFCLLVSKKSLTSTINARLSSLTSMKLVCDKEQWKNHLHISCAVTWHMTLHYVPPSSANCRWVLERDRKQVWVINDAADVNHKLMILRHNLCLLLPYLD